MVGVQEKKISRKTQSPRTGFQNILLATDFSGSANLAVGYAAGLARSFGAKLYAMHVQEPINYALPAEAWQSLELTRELEIDFLFEAVRRECPEITPHVMLGEGTVWRAVEDAVNKNEIDLVVVGTRGRTGIGKAVLGSVAEEILRHASCPVLTVGPRVRQSGRRRGKIASILFATDFGTASLKAARIAISLAEENQAKLTLLHVIDKREAYEMRMPADAGDSCETQLRALVPDDAAMWCEPHYIVQYGVPAEKIVEEADARDADLVVLGVHNPKGVPGAVSHLPIATVHNVIAQATAPVLTVRSMDS
jgi:nucleotide-binding universal stress UspA family protein